MESSIHFHRPHRKEVGLTADIVVDESNRNIEYGIGQ